MAAGILYACEATESTEKVNVKMTRKCSGITIQLFQSDSELRICRVFSHSSSDLEDVFSLSHQIEE